jgi:hypothetical protein
MLSDGDVQRADASSAVPFECDGEKKDTAMQCSDTCGCVGCC